MKKKLVYKVKFVDITYLHKNIKYLRTATFKQTMLPRRQNLIKEIKLQHDISKVPHCNFDSIFA